ncbi:hypothetical protein [Bradyrhizobium elkanii]|uniref:hypothetical protein n=1 Tax=Bradyrhizobium elkanii TaxID=29448 RepID=UPI0035170A89
MTITLNSWAIPVFLTALLWLAVQLWPVSENNGGFGFSQAFDYLLHAVVGIIATLVILLVYFATRFAIG